MYNDRLFGLPTTFGGLDAEADDDGEPTADARDNDARRGRGLVGVERTEDLRGGEAAIE